MRLQLANQIHIGRYDGTDHAIAAARNRVAMKNDGLRTAWNLDRTVGVARIDDIGGIGTCAKGRRPWHEFERPTALETITDPVRLWRYLPHIFEEMLARSIGNAMPIKSGYDA